MSMTDLAGGFASAARASAGFYPASGIMDQLSAAPAIAKIAGPAIAVGVLSIGSRVSMGAMALGCKGLSKVADFAGKKNWSESLNNAKNSLIAGATSTKTIKAEIGAAIALTAGAAGLLGVTKLLTPAPITGYEKLESFGKQVGSALSNFFQAPKWNNYNI